MGNRIFGYARVSSKEQHLDRQILELQKYVKPENILVDKASGKNLEREAYQALKGVLGLRKGIFSTYVHLTGYREIKAI